jgi:hypothetical protein
LISARYSRDGVPNSSFCAVYPQILDMKGVNPSFDAFEIDGGTASLSMDGIRRLWNEERLRMKSD